MMEINPDTIKATTQCSHDFACLKGDKHSMCKIEECVNKKVIFVKYKGYTQCAYRMPFADSTICNCPVRKEIFNKYGL